MSSTNRGYSRHKSDYYVTPLKPIEEFLEEFNKEGLSEGVCEVLDPCAGGDSVNPMSYPEVLKRQFDKIHTLDIREDSLAEEIGNYLDKKLEYEPDLIITNPPFNLARPIIEKALKDVKDGGKVVMLLRLNFFGSKDRRDFFRDNMPTHCFVHHKRISFTKGSTDSIEYAHFVWQKGIEQNHTKLILI